MKKSMFVYKVNKLPEYKNNVSAQHSCNRAEGYCH